MKKIPNIKNKSDDCNVQEIVLLGSSNNESTVGKQVTTANEWDDVGKCCNTWIAIKNCTGTCKYFEPTKSQICLVLMKGLSMDLAYVTGGDHDKPCANCNGQISPCFYKDAINMLTKAAKNCLEKYPYLKNVNLQKFMYNKYFDKEYTYLHKLTGLKKLPHILLPWYFETAMFKNFPDKTYKGFIQITTNHK